MKVWVGSKTVNSEALKSTILVHNYKDFWSGGGGIDAPSNRVTLYTTSLHSGLRKLYGKHKQYTVTYKIWELLHLTKPKLRTQSQTKGRPFAKHTLKLVVNRDGMLHSKKYASFIMTL